MMETDSSPRPDAPTNALRAVRLFCWLGITYVAILGALSLGLHYQVDTAPALPYFDEQEIRTGLDYSFELKTIGWASRVVTFLFLIVLALTPLGRRLTKRMVGQNRSWFVSLLLLLLFLFVVEELLSLPFNFWAFHVRKAWGMTQRSLSDWFGDYVKGLAVSAVFQIVPMIGVYLLIRWKPRSWWVLGGSAAVLLGVGLAFIYPLIIDPIFNTFTPLSQTQWASLEPSVRTLIDQAGLEVGDILVMDASRQGSHSNAYFTGFGSSRRIVLYDNLLKDHTPDEMLSILAHEIGHWRHHHIVKGLTLAALGAFLGCFLLSRILLALARGGNGLNSPADPIRLPMVYLLYVLAAWLALPIQNQVSRYFERQADAASLELARKPDAFRDAEIRLCRTNKSNVVPHPVNAWIFATHPTPLERVELTTRH